MKTFFKHALVVSASISALTMAFSAEASVSFVGWQPAATAIATHPDQQSVAPENPSSENAITVNGAGDNLTGTKKISPANQMVRPSIAKDVPGYQKWERPKDQTLRYIGYGIPEAYSSSGRNIPLDQAVQIIIPAQWHIYAQNGLVGWWPVTWNDQHLPWTDALHTVLRQSHLEAVINWNTESVFLQVPPATPTPKLGKEPAPMPVFNCQATCHGYKALKRMKGGSKVGKVTPGRG